MCSWITKISHQKNVMEMLNGSTHVLATFSGGMKRHVYTNTAQFWGRLLHLSLSWEWNITKYIYSMNCTELLLPNYAIFLEANYYITTIHLSDSYSSFSNQFYFTNIRLLAYIGLLNYHGPGITFLNTSITSCFRVHGLQKIVTCTTWPEFEGIAPKIWHISTITTNCCSLYSLQ